jgi:hypothetical protein
MEDVLDLYDEPYEPKLPVVCFDEMPYQMVAKTRTPVPAKPGRVARYAYEYERRGMVNVFAFFEPKASWRHLDVTERRTAVDFAHAMRCLANEHYPAAEKVRVVLDNPNTHTPASLYKAFEPEEARPASPGVPSHAQARLLAQPGGDRAERGAQAQCLGGRRIPDEQMLGREVGAWERERNHRGATVAWRFTTEDARTKLKRLHPAGS